MSEQTESTDIPVEVTGKKDVEETVEGMQQEDMSNENNEPETAPEETSEVDQLKLERDELKDMLSRRVAELDNAKRRWQQEKDDLSSMTTMVVLNKMLPIFDDLHRALDSAREAQKVETVIEGLKLVLNNATTTFTEMGVERMHSVGEIFDVNKHEALVRQPSDKPENEVLTEFKAGYMYKDKVLRHAQVVLSAGQPEGE